MTPVRDLLFQYSIDINWILAGTFLNWLVFNPPLNQPAKLMENCILWKGENCRRDEETLMYKRPKTHLFGAMAMSLGFDRWFLPASLYGPFVQFQPDLICLLWPWMTKVDFFLTRLVGTIYRLEGLNKRLI